MYFTHLVVFIEAIEFNVLHVAEKDSRTETFYAIVKSA